MADSASPEHKVSDRKAADIARIIDARFTDYRRAFAAITTGARIRFASADWHAAQSANLDRLGLYDAHLRGAADAVRALCGNYPAPGLWHRVKRQFVELLRQRFDYELAETFFNSVHRKVTHGAYVRDDEMFVHSAFDGPPRRLDVDVFARWERNPGESLAALCTRLLRDQHFATPFEDVGRDAARLASAVGSAFQARVREAEHAQEFAFELVRAPFYRNKGAYLIGRILCDDLALPITLPILIADGQLYVDALIAGEDDVSIVFGFTRAYFMVDTPFPSALIAFLQSLMPQKQRSELYAAIGLHKHGKTEFYRDFVRHLGRSDDRFVIAPGIKGMVMAVFTLPSYRTVFKIIKDRFAPQKNTTREQVRAAYALVKRHDRVGRMADTQEFHNMVFPRARFAPDLLDELSATCTSSVQIVDDRVVIAHLYTERAMTPLNIYIQGAHELDVRRALDDYGRAIAELAAANIFAGDMLLKNFGVTRHGRVVFYDYDEICYLTEVNFRRIPPARHDDDELSAEPWFSVAPGDVFPEEFEKFLFGRPGIKKLFRELHGELYDADYWRGLQAKVRAGEVLDVFPYPAERRFAAR